MNLQKWMVAVVFLAILCWAGPVVVPDIQRRWDRCQQAAAQHAREATRLKANLAGLKVQMSRRPPNAQRKWEETLTRVWEREVDYHTRMSQNYVRALYIPWEFYRLGDIP
jgi:hypothetical protein